MNEFGGLGDLHLGDWAGAQDMLGRDPADFEVSFFIFKKFAFGLIIFTSFVKDRQQKLIF